MCIYTYIFSRVQNYCKKCEIYVIKCGVGSLDGVAHITMEFHLQTNASHEDISL